MEDKETQLKTILARIDSRGYIRFNEFISKQLNLTMQPYADIEIDEENIQIAFTPTKKLKNTSFRFISNNTSTTLYFKTALKALGLLNENSAIKTGEVQFFKEGSRWIYPAQKEHRLNAKWKLIPCRVSAGLPMISINPRGTIIFDKNICTQINTLENDSIIPDYNPRTKKFTLRFSKEGYMKVRTIASHADTSFMGTFSAFGIKIPPQSIRIECQIIGNELTFCVAELIKFSERN